MDMLRNLVSGRYSLVKTFWGFGIGGYFLINLIILISFNANLLSLFQTFYIKGIFRLTLAVFVSVGLFAIYRKTLSAWSVIAFLIFAASAVINIILLFRIILL